MLTKVEPSFFLSSCVFLGGAPFPALSFSPHPLELSSAYLYPQTRKPFLT